MLAPQKIEQEDLFIRLAVIRIGLVFAAVLYGAALAYTVVSQWLVERPQADNLERGTRWTSANADIWRQYAEHRAPSLDENDLRAAAQAYQEALRRNPFSAVAWERLAAVQFRVHDSAARERTLRAAALALPYSPSISWSLGNLLLQQGREEEAYPLLRTAAAGDSALRLPLFELGARLLGSPSAVLERLVPEDLASRRDYLWHLLSTKAAGSDALPVWRAVRHAPGPDVDALGLRYTEALAAGNLGPPAAEVWSDVLQRRGIQSERASGVLPNGGFEDTLQNGGLDWLLFEGAGFDIALDAFLFHGGTRSLRVTFDGTENVRFDHIRRWVPVHPGRRYRFEAMLKTENISSDEGVFFVVVSQGSTPKAWNTPKRIGTIPWTREQLDFETGLDSTMVLLQLDRQPSTKLNNRLYGKVWMDDVSLEPLTQ